MDTRYRVSRVAALLALILLAGCDSPAPITKSEARERGGRGPAGEDLCAENGWYGDAECDAWCPMPDVDCPADGGTMDAGTDGGANDAGSDGGATDAGVMDASTDGGATDAGAMDAGSDGGATDAGPASLDAGRDAAAPDDGGTVTPDSGTARCIETLAELPADPIDRTLPAGFALGRCVADAWADTVLRGPGTWRSEPSGPLGWGGLDYRTWPIELDPGQTIVVERTLLDSAGTGGISLTPGPCKNPGSGSASRVERTAVGPENLYLHLWGSRASFEVRITGTPNDHASGTACEAVVAEVALDTPYTHGGSLPGASMFPLGANDAFIHRARSCAGTRHLGRDSVWRVRLRAGERLLATANNFGSMGDDLYAFYLVRDCCNLESCITGRHGSGLAYTATADETLYLVLDTFASGDHPPDAISITVSPP